MSESTSAAQVLQTHTRVVPDFPKPGVSFKDLSPLFRDPQAFHTVLSDVAHRRDGAVDVVAGIEARGFILGAPLAQLMGVGFVPIRKAGKTPGEVLACSYALEYGEATLEVSTQAFEADSRVLLIDDVLATGGTASAACSLVEQGGAHVVALEMLLELSALGGRGKLPGREVYALQTE